MGVRRQDWAFYVPASPRFNAGSYASSLSNALSLSTVGGLIGMVRNGVEVRSCYGGSMYGPGWEKGATFSTLKARISAS